MDKDTPTRQLDVNCFADSCAGKNPGRTGWGGDAWSAALYKVAGVYVESRYSDACKAAWCRISWGHSGDIARVVGEGGPDLPEQGPLRHRHLQRDGRSAKPLNGQGMCSARLRGVHACTSPGGTQHLIEPPNPPTSATTSAAAGPR
ncbi:DUF2690 domain-containing protein [Streptomyces sp. NPDC007189]|uniref:DUF2690 domain-containing protein n=1 Tax=Streptomyces sp. NPDC007189 TaxID=3154315 RepID=UPI003456252B